VSKLSKAQIKAHLRATELLGKDVLTTDDKYFVLDNWNESAHHINSAAGAFFTPEGLASDFAIEVGYGRVIDLCAGIGRLAFSVFEHDRLNRKITGIVCVEINPDYVAVGRKVVPEAEWVCASVFSDLSALGRFDCAISNPPFGSLRRDGSPLRFKGAAFDLAVVEVASSLADYGVFILPQMSCPFRNSERELLSQTSSAYKAFSKATGLSLQPSCISASYHADGWRGVAPGVEVALCDFERVWQAQKEMFAEVSDAPR
jgi:predicted RNA methylase